MTTLAHDPRTGHGGHDHSGGGGGDHSGHGHGDHAGGHAAPTSFWLKYVFSTDHKVIGVQFTLASLMFVIVGGLLALGVRYQLAWPNQNVPFARILPGNMTSRAPEANLALWNVGHEVELKADAQGLTKGTKATLAGFPDGLAVTLPAGTRVEDAKGTIRTLDADLPATIERNDVIGDYDYNKQAARAIPGITVKAEGGELKLVGREIPAAGGGARINDHDALGLPVRADDTAVSIKVNGNAVSVPAAALTYFKASLNPEAYLALFTMHATIMVFFVLMPMLLGGFGNFLIPLMIGARDMAFPKLNMLSFWISVPAAIIMMASFFVPGGASGGGWTMYATLSGIKASPTLGTTLWVASIGLVGFSTIVGTLNYITTIINMRAPGMTMFRMPLTVWSLFITAILALLATPVLTAAAILLFLDRVAGTHFFTPETGGQPLMWQHLFWFFGHPEVYILILPAMGIASEVLGTFCRKPIFGYKPMVFAMAAIGFLGFIVWGHHMFQSGMNPVLGMTFMASTIMIAVPSAIKTFNWLGTIWGGNLRFTVPMCFGLGFVAMFVIGGLSGIFMATAPVDIQIHDTYFIVAHIHYVFFGGTVFGVFAGLYYWFPKMFGRQMNQRWGYAHFWMTLIGFNWAFFTMHILGVGGHPRRYASIIEYPTLQHLQPMNVFMTVGALMLGCAQLPFFYNFFVSLPRKLGRAATALFVCGLAAPFVIAQTYYTHVSAGTGLTTAYIAAGYLAVVAALLILPGLMLRALPGLGRVFAVLIAAGTLALVLWPFYGEAATDARKETLQLIKDLTVCVGIGLWFCLAATLVVFAVWFVGGKARVPAILQRLLYVVTLPAFLAPLLLKPDPYLWIGAPGLFQQRWLWMALVALPGLAYLLFKRPNDEFGHATSDNPWEANTLEWATSSPPPFVNFHEIPHVHRGPYEYSSPVVEEDYLPQSRKLPASVVEPAGH